MNPLSDELGRQVAYAESQADIAYAARVTRGLMCRPAPTATDVWAAREVALAAKKMLELAKELFPPAGDGP